MQRRLFQFACYASIVISAAVLIAYVLSFHRITSAWVIGRPSIAYGALIQRGDLVLSVGDVDQGWVSEAWSFHIEDWPYVGSAIAVPWRPREVIKPAPTDLWGNPLLAIPSPGFRTVKIRTFDAFRTFPLPEAQHFGFRTTASFDAYADGTASVRERSVIIDWWLVGLAALFGVIAPARLLLNPMIVRSKLGIRSKPAK